MKTKHTVVSREDNATLKSMGFKLHRGTSPDGKENWRTYFMHEVSLKGMSVADDHNWRDDHLNAVLYVNAPNRDFMPDSPFAAGHYSLPGRRMVGFDNIIEAATFLRLKVIEVERRRLAELADAIKADEQP